ncbi:MJ1255/VC2487 family glycosyltransferase [Salinibius halmophilus]|uniref:MJ1255/VC2487 family glycosyltransferase n=1 Tax=Salinibius halmophilus TaxID=1853216 RepID=UPI000E67536D|nr:MJ1255/VC2487 family glycosyltransferase [Salinibius halmophilus]
MKILFGVQATGNGHITRARSLAPELKRLGVEVQWLFSGRAPEQLFDMDVFGNYIVRQGMTFVTEAGKLNAVKTIQNARIGLLYKEVKSLDIEQYDLVITDFEPVSAWAAKRAGVRSIAIGHQYAFRHQIPVANETAAAKAIMRWFAPGDLEVGLHWHHFQQPILPPLIEPEVAHTAPLNKVLVYLPFESGAQVLQMLQAQNATFEYFCGDLAPGVYGNVTVHGFSRTNFQTQLHQCGSVLCNAGFELASEALQLGRRILVKPVRGQMEQCSNAAALEQLGYGSVMKTLDSKKIASWLATQQAVAVKYPNVANAIAHWIASGAHESVTDLANKLWTDAHLPAVTATSAKGFDAQLA